MSEAREMHGAAERLPAVATAVARTFQRRCAGALKEYVEATGEAAQAHASTARALSPFALWQDAASYWADAAQRSLLFWDTLRQRGNNWLEHERAGNPPLFDFDWEIVLDARKFERPVNYALVSIKPPAGVSIDPDKRPFVVIDPRAGHGPGIGGFKQDSQVGVALRAGHPVYVVIFFPQPEDGQTLADVARVETEFLRHVRERHPTRGKPVIIGNCQGGWAAMLVGALDPDAVGPIVVNGAPMSYWAGNDAENPMRYAGGMLGGSWTAQLACDLGGGKFDGAYLVDNFEYLNPANTFFQKLYHVYANVDTEPERFLEFERWWGGYFLMNREEITWIVENLFVGNRLASGEAEWANGKTFDLKAIRSPIILFASLGDNITPPQQAFNWVADLYPTTEALEANNQVIVGLMHESVGHLGIFVSGAVARREHAQIVDLLEHIEHLPPGLYGMRIEEEKVAGGGKRYDATITKRRVEDLQRLQKYSRRDEVPFEAVAQVSELNARAYETFVHPWLSTMVPPQAGALARAFHPLRAQRWGISDLNPFLAPLGALAGIAKGNRVTRDPDGPSATAERWMAANVVAGFELYRQLRDATVENLFFNVYGPMSLAFGEEAAPAEEAAQAPEAAPDPLAEIEKGGFTDAAVRAGLLVARHGRRQMRISRMKRIRELVGKQVGLLALPADAAQEIIRRQAHIVDSDPERAMATLPKLLKTADERERILILLEKLASNVEINPEQRALLPEFRKLLTEREARPARAPTKLKAEETLP